MENKEYYKSKYLKYKTKYTILQKTQSGGGIFDIFGGKCTPEQKTEVIAWLNLLKDKTVPKLHIDSIKEAINNNLDVSVIVERILSMHNYMKNKPAIYSQNDIDGVKKVYNNLTKCCKGDDNKLLPECKPNLV